MNSWWRVLILLGLLAELPANAFAEGNRRIDTLCSTCEAEPRIYRVGAHWNGSVSPQPREPLNFGQPIPPTELENLVDGLIGKAMDGNRVAGVAVSIVQDGQVILKKGYGIASLSPAREVDPDATLFTSAPSPRRSRRSY